MESKGKRRMVWLSPDLDSLMEETRKSIGMSRSGFLRYSLVRLLEDLSVLSNRMHEKRIGDLQVSTSKFSNGVFQNE